MAGSRPTVGVGVIGCGRVAETRHLPALAALPQARVVAVADVDPHRLTRVADRFGVAARYADFRRLLDLPSLDAVAVCVPAAFHGEVALAVLDAGRHLLVEKPLALTLDDADRLIERAGRSAVRATVGFNLRQHALVRRARTMIEGGGLGAVEAIRTALTSATRFERDLPEWRSRRERGGGALFEMAVHHFDLWRFLLGAEVDEVFATSRSDGWHDGVTTVTARLGDGGLASTVVLEGTAASNEVDVYGSGGHLRASLYRFDGLEVSPVSGSAGDLRARLGGVARSVTSVPAAVSALRGGGVWAGSYRAQWSHFLDCIRDGVAPGCTLVDGRRALEVALAAAQSASVGRPVSVGAAPRRIPAVT